MHPSNAHGKVNKAVKKGLLTPTDVCELCGAICKPVTVSKNGREISMPTIKGHHWNGYDNPLDVWWLCARCNMILIGPKFHSGLVSKDEAKSFIANFENAPKGHPRASSCKFGGCRNWADESSDYCSDHSRSSESLGEVLTVHEVAAYLRVSRSTVWRWCNDQKLRSFKAGHGWRVHRVDLEEYIKDTIF